MLLYPSLRHASVPACNAATGAPVTPVTPSFNLFDPSNHIMNDPYCGPQYDTDGKAYSYVGFRACNFSCPDNYILDCTWSTTCAIRHGTLWDPRHVQPVLTTCTNYKTLPVVSVYDHTWHQQARPCSGGGEEDRCCKCIRDFRPLYSSSWPCL